jgi:hypothetical protein
MALAAVVSAKAVMIDEVSMMEGRGSWDVGGRENCEEGRRRG